MADFLGAGEELGPFRAGILDTVCNDDSAHGVYEGEGCRGGVCGVKVSW